MKLSLTILTAVVILFFAVDGFLATQPVHAGELKDNIINNLVTAQGKAKLPAYTDPAKIVGLVIKGLLGVVMIIFFIIIIIAGLKWMTSDGNEETISKAKKSIQSGIIGLLVVMFSYGITVLVFDIILQSNVTG